MGEVVRFPTLYRIAWSDGEREGLIDGHEFRNKRNAEDMVRLLQDYGHYPGLLLWVHHIGDALPTQPPDIPPAA